MIEQTLGFISVTLAECIESVRLTGLPQLEVLRSILCIVCGVYQSINACIVCKFLTSDSLELSRM